MKQPAANISNAVLLSIGLHCAILGSALAFAQYGGSPFGRALPHIMVSLGDWQGQGYGKDMPRAARTALRVPPRAHDDPLRRSEEHHPVRELMPDAAAAGGDPVPPSDAGGIGSIAGPQSEQVPEGRRTGSGSNGDGYSPDQWQQLYTALEKVKSYPRFARERGIEGTVLVRLRVLPSGEVGSVDIVQSSGSEILDTATVRTLYLATPLPFVDGWVEVPMSYVLK